MLNKDTQKKLKDLGFDVKALVAAVTNEDEVDFDVPEITSYSEDELSARDDNNKKAGIAEGKKTGLDIAIKTIAKKLNLEGEFKDPDAISKAISEINGKTDNEQISLLQKRAETAEYERDNALSTAKTAKRDAELLSSFPANRRSDLSDAEYLSLFKLSHDIAEDDGKTVIKKGGVVLRDEKTQNPVDFKSALDSFFTERKFVGEQQQQQQGRGGSDRQQGGGSGIKTYSKAEEQFKKDNPDKGLMGTEFQAYLGQLAKAPDFDMNA